jgi:mRNA interferase MazF
MKRGDLYRVYRPGGDPKHFRVYVVVGRQIAINSRFSTVICAPIYSNGAGLTTQVQIGVDEGLKHSGWITCDELMSMRKSDLTNFVGSLSLTKIAELNRALGIALDLR